MKFLFLLGLPSKYCPDLKAGKTDHKPYNDETILSGSACIMVISMISYCILN